MNSEDIKGDSTSDFVACDLPGQPPCNCKSELEAKLTARFAEMEPTATGHSAELMGYSFGIMGNAMVQIGVMEVKASATYPLKKGGTKKRTLRQSMVFSFCPFCGQKADVRKVGGQS